MLLIDLTCTYIILLMLLMHDNRKHIILSAHLCGTKDDVKICYELYQYYSYRLNGQWCYLHVIVSAIYIVVVLVSLLVEWNPV